MYIKVSWDEDFDSLMMHLWSKYGRDMFTLDGIGDQLDLNKFAKTFFKPDNNTADVSVDSNANVTGKSVIDFNFEFPKPLQRYNSYYMLWKTLKKQVGLQKANELIEKQLTGELYINDFVDIGRPYCFNYSTYDIALMGLDVSTRMKINPPKSLMTFLRQVEQFLVVAANSTLGATGIADLLIVASHYVEKIFETGYDGHIKVVEPDTYVREWLSSFIYTVNWEFRGNQSPFTNVSVYDTHFLEDLCKEYMFDGKGVEPVYAKFVQSTFLLCMNKELIRSPLTFPVTTACLTKDNNGEIKDEEFLDLVAKQNMKYGFINFYTGDSTTLSSCCRLRSDITNEYFNSFGAGSSKIGSLGVVTANLPRLAEMSTDLDDFVYRVKDAVQEASLINNAKRSIIKKRIELGSLAMYNLGYMDLKKQYSTFGVVGLNEALQYLGLDITTVEGSNFVKELLNEINYTNDFFQTEFDAPHNCEQIPAEGVAVKLAKKDSKIGFNKNGYKLYSNQFIPLTTQSDAFERIRLQGEFDDLFSGGAICHFNVGEEIKDVEVMKDLIRHAAREGVVYWAVNYKLKRCENEHVWVDGDTCPTCGGSVHSVFTRVVGFFTNVDNWNETRREEDFPNRVFYDIP